MVRNIKRTVKKLLNSAISCIVKLFTRVKKEQILFISFNGKSYSDNPKAISEALHKLSPDLKIVWGFFKPEIKATIVPTYVKCENFKNVFRKYRALYSSAVVVTNFEFPNIIKSKKQFFIQTWHGDRAFKKVLHATAFFNKRLIPESKDGFCDLAIAGSKYGEMQYRTAFLYKGEVVINGTPRDDILVRNDLNVIKKVKESIGILQNKKVLLFAPTLRSDVADRKSDQQINLDIQRTLSLLNHKYQEDWICLVRAHPAISSLAGIEYSHRIINVNKYEDMAELLLVSDMLITDYSSCAGDFALLKKPIILFQPDIDDYLKNEREFYFDIKESPYYIANSQEQLENIICKLDCKEAEKNCKDILDFYGTTETGRAAEIVAQRIIDWINNKT